jgi:hypothetical protein
MLITELIDVVDANISNRFLVTREWLNLLVQQLIREEYYLI